MPISAAPHVDCNRIGRMVVEAIAPLRQDVASLKTDVAELAQPHHMTDPFHRRTP